jgi:hypothetical protein
VPHGSVSLWFYLFATFSSLRSHISERYRQLRSAVGQIGCTI